MSFELIVITAPVILPDEIRQIVDLFDAGLSTLHVRKPGLTAHAVAGMIEQIPEQFHHRLVVHHHDELLQYFKLKGIHGVRKKIASVTRSLSLHHWSECADIPSYIDYVLVSPVFDSLSKRGYAGNPLLHQKPEMPLHYKLIAMGGVTPVNIEQLLKEKWDGAAILGCIWNDARNAQVQFRAIQNSIKSQI